MLKFFASCPLGLEGLLFNEIVSLNIAKAKETTAGVSFEGTMEDGMRLCLYSHFASRILLTLSTFNCEDDTDLYLGANGIAWENYFTSDKTISVEFSGTNDKLRNTQYSALKIKDAICDRLVKAYGSRPDVDKHNSDVRIYAHLLKYGEATITLDLSGSPLHQREYHRGTGIAPLKENLAAAMVVRAGYDNFNFIDPMCGSGTLLLEAALYATDTAPGLKRSRFGFLHLKDFDENKWQEMLFEAKVRSNRGLKSALEKNICIHGFDADSNMVSIAQQNAKKAGFGDLIKVSACSVAKMYNPFDNDLHVTLVTNPPYGQRMGNFNELIALYSDLGLKIKQNFKGSRAAIISTSTDLLSCLRLSYDKSYKLYNGSLLCQLRVFEIDDSRDMAGSEGSAKDEIAVDFANRLVKNLKTLNKWAEGVNTDAYRVYDADLPDYQACIDKYGPYYVIQEYAAPSSVSANIARRRVLDMIAATIRVTGSDGEHVVLKERERQRGSSQYEKSQQQKHDFFSVHEGSINYRVNVHDYLDTGLFLDARPIREKIKALASGKDFLNLFAYTASASVAAAMGGALSTVSVDMSRTYLEWGMENFRQNNIDLASHDFVQADCLAYISNPTDKKYDLIYIDPPTFSNSKRMESTFEVQRDHVALLSNLTGHLKDGGSIIFCTNKRNFNIDGKKLALYGLEFEDISKATIPRDFMRRQQIHSCYILAFDESKKQLDPVPIVEQKAVPKWSGSVKKSSYSSSSFDRNSDRGSDRGFNRDNKDRDFNSRSSAYGGRQNRSKGFKVGSMTFNKDGRINSDSRSDRSERRPARKARVWGPVDS
ncbi:Ribosomal RNA large subunit methyltransferase L [Anaerobiospirillum thomasii]|uniref:bifunctional 23S rRNA (guanine(2069)-N(7))-methyltransferase RlmK/23S rRNA (guanine(2445)-N(2))-methyltransferase RlmL n=1 Tax=Anaerobiospirillum thomasii TaxID=179995 RepID=UPI000DA078DD|nr:bifunctional 23S rRNA (guanine(2069)-N(7))-methyltransferase RlmK/23S rRNA (guanine(2445)-N(2))-methyltransferase RlmL [Anaerobiospirillum thomasii]SPT67750.1 Ribosomal RNA large subunit methyltransferase L [Anaerobiospirillum thomasii]